jgi:hypothetical protein
MIRPQCIYRVFLMALFTLAVKVLPTAADSPDFRFVVLADSRGEDHGANTLVMDTILSEIKQLQPQVSFALIPGDLVVGSKDPKNLEGQLRYYKKTLSAFYPIEFFYPGIGNHEVMHDNKGERLFGKVFSEFNGSFLRRYGRTVYFFDRGNSRFFMLSTDHPSEMHTIAAAQLAWIKKNIDPAKKHNFFFMHEPSYPTGYYVGSAQDVDPFCRNEFWDLIDSLKGSMVFCGHEHFYSRRHIDRVYNETVNGKEFAYDKVIYQVTIGGFGGPLSESYVAKDGVDVPPIAAYHYAVVDVKGDTVGVTIQSLNGKILDHFILPGGEP